MRIFTTPRPRDDQQISPWVAERRKRQRRIEKDRRLAEKSLRNGQPGLALATYLSISEEGPEALGMLNRASEPLFAARPDSGIALLLRIASIYRREDLPAKAVAIYKKALRLDPTRPDVHQALAEAYRQRGL